MTDALTGQPRREPTLRERANAPRIGRARFIGNAIGYILFAAIVGGALQFAAGKVPALADPAWSIPVSGRDPLPLLHRGAILALIAILLATIGELAVRRRHDRNHTSLDVVVWLEVVLGDAVLHLFGPPFEYSFRIDVVLGAFGLWFFVLLCLLPGTKGPNRYGPDPRTRH